jgi:hypothetical protein
MDKTEGPSAHFLFDYLFKDSLQIVPSGDFPFPEKVLESKRTNAENTKTHSWISGALLEMGSKRGKRDISSERRCQDTTWTLWKF